MKIAFFSNFLNHHQLPLCEALCANADVEFTFVACERIPDERIRQGYSDMNSKYPFVVREYEDKATAREIALEYDAVIFGSCSVEYLKMRMEQNKLSFRFCERSLKKGTWRRFIPRTRKKIKEGYVDYRDKPLFVLAASAFASYDLHSCGFPVDKCFKWGYFPKGTESDFDTAMAAKAQNDKVKLLWAGRFLKLKRVPDILSAIKVLVSRGITNIHLTLIGGGEEKETLSSIVSQKGLSAYVEFIDSVAAEKVAGYMDRSDIYIFTSNYLEGWGAVVNEAMSSSCVPVVSCAAGSCAYLVRHAENGYAFKCADTRALAYYIEVLATDRELRHRMAKKANATVREVWCADTAATRLVEFCTDFLSDGAYKPHYEDGPMSYAEVIKNNWIKRL